MTYVLRNVPPELWSAVKTRTVAERRPLRALFLALLRAYVDGRVAL